MKAVLYMGTGCNSAFMRQIKTILEDWGFESRIVCWTNSNNPVDYANVPKYNIQSGQWDLAIGHSAGGFPLPITKAKYRIGINPFLAIYPAVDVVLHAKDDWLTLPDKPTGNVKVYEGKHSTVPEQLLRDVLSTRFGSPKNTGGFR